MIEKSEMNKFRNFIWSKNINDSGFMGLIPITGGHLGFCQFAENAQGYASGIIQIQNQHPRIDKKPSKNIVYTRKQGHPPSSLD